MTTMLTQEQVLTAITSGRESKAWPDSRDYGRLTAFFPKSDLPALGFTMNGEAEHVVKAWTRENIVAELTGDLAYAFEKAMDKRGISSGLMLAVVQMWCWILGEDELADNEADYAQYGLPILKAVALKFGLPNPIGDDRGNEYKYSSGGE